MPILVGCALFSDWKTEMHYLPKSYRGPVLIVYNHPRGQPVPEVEGRRIYRIPENGILLVNGPPQKTEPTWVPDNGMQYFAVAEKDTQRLDVLRSFSELYTRKQVCVYGHVAYGGAGSDNGRILYESYFVGKSGDNTDSLEAELHKRLFQVLDSLHVK